MEFGSKGTGQQDRSHEKRAAAAKPAIVWILLALALVGGLVLSVLALTASPGDVIALRLDLIGYLVTVIAGAAFFAYADRQRDAYRKKGKPRQPRI